MNKILAVMRKDRLYILLLIFVLVFNLIVFTQGQTKDRAKHVSTTSISSNKAEMEAALRKNTNLLTLVGLVSLLVLAILFLGIVIDIMIASAIFRRKLNIRTFQPGRASWSAWDVAKVIILFLFFGYVIIVSEASLSRVLPVFKSDNFRMMVNSSVLDILAVVFILYFSVISYKEKLMAVGLSLKNFSKNIFYGVVGYIALVPVLVLIIVITAVILHITKYVPERQPVVELFLKEKDMAFITYSSLFAAIVGPIIEELFFRGFLYGACKKYIGIFWSIVLTAAIFAALHTHPVGFAPIMALGVLLAYLYEKTGTLVSSITVHIIHNLSMVFLIFLIKQIGVV